MAAISSDTPPHVRPPGATPRPDSDPALRLSGGITPTAGNSIHPYPGFESVLQVSNKMLGKNPTLSCTQGLIRAVDSGNVPAERRRIQEAGFPDAYVPKNRNWRLWGPYTADRQWGTVREDYSPDGEAWNWFTHDDARSRAYRWGEDALLGYSDKLQLLNFSLALWNERDPIIKERLFGLTNTEGPHGEDVKEVYYFTDATPTSSYLAATYRYPMDKYPYDDLIRINAERRKTVYEQRTHVPEFELHETGIFDDNRFWDITVEYAKNDPIDTSIRISVENCSRVTNKLHVLPSLYYRNTWSWYPENYVSELGKPVVPPHMRLDPALASPGPDGAIAISCDPTDGLDDPMTLLIDGVDSIDQALFCCNETRISRFEGRSICRSLYKRRPTSNFPKDCINNAVVCRNRELCNPDKIGSKMATDIVLEVPPGEKRTIVLRLLPTRKAREMKKAARIDADSSTSDLKVAQESPFFSDAIFSQRKKEADQFYEWLNPHVCTEDRKLIQRQAYAGMLWTRQTYIFDVQEWLSVGPGSRKTKGSRNLDWTHLSLCDVITVCDGWEYPWFATWDLAFHLIVYAHVDPEFAKQQCLLLLRPGIRHPSGGPPAYEWEFSDFNPPLHAWSAHKIFCVERDIYGVHDTNFLTHAFPLLSQFFSWYMNKADVDGHGLLGKSFLGLDNIAIINRSDPPKSVKAIYQVDGTAWAGFMAMNLMKIALELNDPKHLDFAAECYVTFGRLSSALNNFEDGLPHPTYDAPELYCPIREWYYDVIRLHDGKNRKLECRTLVGIIPLFAVETVDMKDRDLSVFVGSISKLMEKDKNSSRFKTILELSESPRSVFPESCTDSYKNDKYGVYLVTPDRLRKILKTVLDPQHFLGEYGIRSATKDLMHSPYKFDAGEGERVYHYLPAESYGDGKFFGGNSSWRGAIWAPTMYMLIDGLMKYYDFLGKEWKVECPTGSGIMMNLKEVSLELARRFVKIFDRRPDGSRPVYGDSSAVYNRNERWRQNPLFFEYFHGCDGRGVGASHQTGWTGLIADLIGRLAYEDVQLTDE